MWVNKFSAKLNVNIPLTDVIFTVIVFDAR